MDSVFTSVSFAASWSLPYFDSVSSGMYDVLAVALAFLVLLGLLLVCRFRGRIAEADGHPLGKMIPHERRNEIHHLSTKSTQLAGFALTFFIILVGFYRQTPLPIFGPGLLLLTSFVFLLGVSHYSWNSYQRWQFILAEAGHKIGILLLLLAGFWTFNNIFGDFPVFLVLLGILYGGYVIWDLKKMYGNVNRFLERDTTHE